MKSSRKSAGSNDPVFYYLPYVIFVVIFCGKIYIGQTNDLEKRICDITDSYYPHKKSFTHKQKGNWRVVYKEDFLTRSEVMGRERELKSAKGREYIKKVLPL